MHCIAASAAHIAVDLRDHSSGLTLTTPTCNIKVSKLKKKSGKILIKLPKKKQDLRMDLPTIGFNTLKDCRKYGLKGIVLKSKKNIFLDKDKCIRFANKNNIFIKVI